MTDPGGKVVLTTGANSGIGLATVVKLATLGFRSVGTVRSESKAATVTAAAEAAGVSVETVMLDVTDEMRCAEVVDRVRPWAIVNNAGYSGVGAIEDVSDEEARKQLETMVVAPMRLARLALPHMRTARDGRIVNVSSIYGLTTPDGVTGRSDQGTYVSACLCVLVTVSSLGRLAARSRPRRHPGRPH